MSGGCGSFPIRRHPEGAGPAFNGRVRDRLKIVVLLERPHSPQPWVARLLDRIYESAELELCALLEPVRPMRQAFRNPFIAAWMRMERHFVARPQAADCSGWAAREGVSVVAQADEATIGQVDPDVILDLTGDFGAGCRPQLARHGIWFADFFTGTPGAGGLRAILDRQPVSRIGLFRRTADRAVPVAIAMANLNTKFVAARNDLFMCEKVVTLILRELKRTWMGGRVGEVAGVGFHAPLAPRVGEFALYLAGLAREALARAKAIALTKLRLRPGMFYLRAGTGDFLSFRPQEGASLLPTGNSYYADPFLWDHGGETYCYFEQYDYGTSKGHIGVGKLVDGQLTDIRTALSTDYHLSFPFLFQDGGVLYMIPETCGARRVEVWKCEKFPDRWTRYATALEGVVAADSTLNRINGDWWLFTNVSADPFGEMNSELHLFRVDGPALKTVVPHGLNPVVFDSRTARNAGRIFHQDCRYYRPSQDNSHGLYGYGLNLMRIDRLTDDEYRETLVRHIEPDFDDGVIGCHHLDMRDGTIIIDARKKVGGW